MLKNACVLCKIVGAIAIIGALNWGLIGLSGTNLVENRSDVDGSPSPGSMWSSRGSSGGTLTRAKCSLPVLGLTSTTARLSESPEM